MKRLVLTLAFVVASLVTPSAAPFRTAGDYIFLTGLDDAGCVWSFISAYRTPSGTTLAYDLQDFCSATDINGTYAIPSSALIVTPTRATLTVITPNGEIRVALNRSGFSSLLSVGQVNRTFGNVSIRSHSTLSEQSTAATGVVFGRVLAGAIGTVGTSQDLYIEIVKK